MTFTENRLRPRTVLGADDCLYAVFCFRSHFSSDRVGFEVGMLPGSVASAVVLGASALTLEDTYLPEDLIETILRADDYHVWRRRYLGKK